MEAPVLEWSEDTQIQPAPIRIDEDELDLMAFRLWQLGCRLEADPGDAE